MALDLAAFESNYQPYKFNDPKKKLQGKGGTLTSLISEGGALGGAAAGATIGSAVPIVGTVIGGAIGAGLGAFGGRLAENKVRDDRFGVGDAAKEGALSAVLGAPIRAAKYGVKAIQTSKAGGSIDDALRAGAQVADAPGALRAKIGNKISEKGGDLLVKEFGLTPTQLTNFKTKYGEDVTSTIRRHNLTGKDSEQIGEAVIKPLQDQFDLIPGALPQVSRQTVESAFKSKYSPLLNSAVQDNKSAGQALKKQSQDILKKYGDTVDAGELNTLRKEFDSLVSYADKQADPARYGVNKRAADALRTVLQKEADKAGIKTADGQSFKDLGKELSKLRQLNDNVARQENRGRGSLPVGLTNLLGGVVGSGSLGPLGALGGAAATMAANSSVGRRALSQGAKRVGDNLAAPSTASNLSAGLKVGATGAIAGGIAGAATGDQFLSNSNEPSMMSPTITNPPMNANMSQQYSNTGDLSSTLAAPQGPVYTREAALSDMQRDPANREYYAQLYEFANPKQEEAGGLNTTTANLVASSANATDTLDQLEGLFGTAGGGSGQVGGRLKNALAGAGLDGNAQTYNDLSASSVSQLARALNGGGQVSDADAAVVVQALPRITDSPEVAQRKFAALRARLASARENTLMYNAGASQSSNTLDSALAI